MLENEEQFIADRLFPHAKSLKLTSMAVFRLENDCEIVLEIVGSEVESVKTVLDRAKQFWHILPKVSVRSCNKEIEAEGYEIEIAETQMTIRAATRQGVLYALQSLRQLAEYRFCDDGIDRWLLPAVTIQDAPRLKFRGLHICFFPETPSWEIERSIRLAAAYKFNHLILEPWGTFKYDCHPEYCWSEFAQPPAFFRYLVHLGRDLGIRVCPQLNLFGHASQSRGASGKHVLLDLHPEYDSLFEPDGWTFCLSNPKTRPFLTDLMEELLDVFENPPYFHIGCDEATSAKTCLNCRRHSDYAGLVKDHILHFHDLLKQHGTNTILWFDMFLQRQGHMPVAPTKMGLQEVYKELPRDLFVCDVEYGYLPSGDVEFEWSVSKTCHDLGYHVLVAPWDEPTGTENLCRYAEKLQLDGMLCTTWHHHHEPDMRLFYQFAGSCAWNPSHHVDGSGNLFHRDLRFVTRDMELTKYRQFGSAEYQMAPESFTVRDLEALRKDVRKVLP